jgi:hypothetical protein
LTTFLERYLKKTKPEEITYRDIVQFLQQEVEENQNLEYKPRGLLVKQDGTVHQPANRWDIVGFSALAKSVAGFANAEGGLLVLGVKEIEDKNDGVVIKKRPGPVSALPTKITREQIENQLQRKIQYPIDGITIVPVYPENEKTSVIYLIDIPQSVRVPHRVDELHYYQRYNFSTHEMKHFQVADLFGKRLVPDLDILVRKIWADSSGLKLRFLIRNQGRAVAKYVTCNCRVVGNSYKVIESGERWSAREGEIWQWVTGLDSVVYPDIHLDMGTFTFRLVSEFAELPAIHLVFGLYAEGMRGKEIPYSLNPSVLEYASL